ncbi:LysE family translocator [Pantoea tagorei]
MIPFSNGFFLSLSLCLDIGLANIAMITLAMQRGYFHGFCLGVGTCVGDLIYALLAMAGMAILLQYEAVRWILWLGGGAMLIWFAVKMFIAAFQNRSALKESKTHHYRSLLREFGRGILLALSSPTAILWFATVGGALISRMGQHSLTASASFFRRFFLLRACSGPAWYVWLAASAANCLGIDCLNILTSPRRGYLPASLFT